MVKRILALSLLMVCLSACGGQEDPAGDLAAGSVVYCSESTQCHCTEGHGVGVYNPCGS